MPIRAAPHSPGAEPLGGAAVHSQHRGHTRPHPSAGPKPLPWDNRLFPHSRILRVLRTIRVILIILVFFISAILYEKNV